MSHGGSFEDMINDTIGGLERSSEYKPGRGYRKQESSTPPRFNISATTAQIVRRELAKLVLDKWASSDEPLQLGLENIRGWPRISRLTHRCHAAMLAINAAFRSSEGPGFAAGQP